MRYLKWIIPFLLILILPFVIWYWQDQQFKEVDIVILDKTVANNDTREHKGLIWLLNHLHFKNKEGNAFDDKKDYVGTIFKDGNLSVKDLEDDISHADFIYVADTYGVYESKVDGTDSRISGGLTAKEWATIKHAVDKEGVPLVIEFNSISSPTEPFVREEVSRFLGMEQQGWTGRYFNDLSQNNSEIPSWIFKAYEVSNSQKWTFKGEGILFVQENSNVVKVLSVEEGLLDQGDLQMIFNEKGMDKFNLRKSGPYRYWFDVTTAIDEKGVLANFKLPVSSKGKLQLEEWGIPTVFPAIIESEQKLGSSYYFAGDFVDMSEIPSFYQYSGFTKVREWLSFDEISPEQSFYWKTYIPIMKVLLKDIKPKDQKALQAKYQPSMLENKEGLSYSSRVKGNRFEVYQNGAWEEMTIKGVNIGMGKPGAFPGEGAITKAEYERWFQQIGEMNANAIRIYTLHPPAFYEALKEYNETHEKPLYIFQGVWSDEAPLEETLDAYTPEITEEFQKEFKNIADVIHGNAEIEPRPGHSSGTYTADVSPYVLGWILGIEWYPEMVDNMAKKYKDATQFEGKYIQTKGAIGFELWMAEQMDTLTSYEADTYQWTRPMSYTNWVTTDNIKQPAEPFPQEDIASVDPNHIQYKNSDAMPGMFASYHVYPYYPDFLNLDERYTEYIDHRGEKNNYAGYLRDLKESHDMPVLIAEFGIPASRGLTHLNPLGLNQGFHTEQEQGELLQRLYEDIIEADMMGGLIFAWQDEWFKRTWNTVELDDANRRPFWSNAQTNEQHFGLLNFDRMAVHTDGQQYDWRGIDPSYQSEKEPVSSMYTTSDERYLYVRLDGDAKSKWLSENKAHLLFDVTSISGNDQVDKIKNIQFNQPFADFWLSFDSVNEAELKVDAYYDVFYNLYGVNLKMLNPPIVKPKQNSGSFNEIHLALNKEFKRPDTGEIYPFSSYNTGEMRFGNSNPTSSEFDSLADYYYDEKTGILEIRIPWLLLNMKDPSSKKAFGDLYMHGVDSEELIDDIGIAFVLVNQQGKVVQSYPQFESGSMPVDQVFRYNWEKWERPQYTERLKLSYTIIQETFKNTP